MTRGKVRTRTYIYQCTFCKTEQVVHMGGHCKARQRISGFCAKDKHARTEFKLMREVFP
jgi:hypothetical protein